MNKELIEKMVTAQLQIETKKLGNIDKQIKQINKDIHDKKLSRSEVLKEKNRILREIDEYLLRVGGIEIDKTNY